MLQCITLYFSVLHCTVGEEGKALGSLVSWHKGLQGGLERVAQYVLHCTEHYCYSIEALH